MLVGRLGTAVISLLSLMILSRILSTEEMGVYQIALMVINLALILGLNWSDSSIIRHGREEFVNSGRINLSFWARSYIFIPVMLFFCLTFIFFGGQITRYIGVAKPIIYLIIGIFVLTGIINSLSFLFQSIDRMGHAAYILLLQKIFYIIGLCLIYSGIITSGILPIFLIMNISFILALTAYIFLFDFHLILPYKLDRRQFRRIWSYSWPQLIGFSGLYVINYIDLYVIKNFMTLHDVGVYSIAYNGFTMIGGFIMLVHTIFLPLIVEYRSKSMYGNIRKYLQLVPIASSLFAAGAMIGVFFSPFIVAFVFSDKYVEAIPSFNILLITSSLYFASVCLLPVINAYDFIIYSQVFNIARAVINAVLDFIWVPRIGIEGAAYATLVAYALGLILSIALLFYKKKSIFAQASAG